MARRTTAQATMSAAERRAQVVQLKRTKLSFAEIGRRLGITGQRAGQLYREALAQVPRMAVEEHRVEELELYDTAIHQLMRIASSQDPTVTPRTKVEAWTAIRGFAERKAKLLGLDAPARHEVISLDAIDAEIAELTRALAGGAEATETSASP
jgi:hypothetical protein